MREAATAPGLLPPHIGPHDELQHPPRAVAQDASASGALLLPAVVVITQRGAATSSRALVEFPLSDLTTRRMALTADAVLVVDDDAGMPSAPIGIRVLRMMPASAGCGAFVERDARVHSAGIGTIRRAAPPPMHSDSPTCPESRKMAVSLTKDTGARNPISMCGLTISALQENY